MALCGSFIQRSAIAQKKSVELTSRWQMTWAQRAHHATVRLDNCTIDRVPVVLEKSRDSWWLWWVPAPHLDNSAFTFFTFTLWIDGASCRIAGP